MLTSSPAAKRGASDGSHARAPRSRLAITEPGGGVCRRRAVVSARAAVQTSGTAPARRTWVLALLALGIGTVAALVIAELAVRVYLYGPGALWPPTMDGIRQIGVSGMIRASPDLDIQYELKPDLHDVRYKKVHVTTNSAGWRDKEWALAKPPGTFRVAVIGDSFTMADGIEIEDVYHSLMEDRLNAQHGARKYEFLNFGVAGYQLPQYVAVIEKRALAYQPDLILVGFSTNDFVWFEDQAKVLFSKPYEVKPVEHPFFQFHFARWVKDRIAALRAGPDRGGELSICWCVQRSAADFTVRPAAREIPRRGQRDSWVSTDHGDLRRRVGGSHSDHLCHHEGAREAAAPAEDERARGTG